jgi:hypothetical protein
MIPLAAGLITSTPSSEGLVEVGEGARGRITPPMGSLEEEARAEEVGILETVVRRNWGVWRVWGVGGIES